ncbi:DNA replication endonuclease-helicase Dna2 [Coemansia spiralis]|uniref:DNA replication ATP-dependent helicase/nuclease n=1 Tax=Coemansia spiralis TaxID=417178 RepID=A0A9W8L646_9FUNG|nr:DNA replication endonuclease-helicase Dna2 [Coemansia spiralis]
MTSGPSIPQKRQREGTFPATAEPRQTSGPCPITPQRHCSADSPLATRARLAPGAHEAGSSGVTDDVILWQSMSPSGTLRNVVRQRTLPSQKDVLLEETNLTRGIVQQIIDRRVIDSTGFKAANTAINQLSRGRSILKTMSSDLGSEAADIGSSYCDIPPADMSVEITPMANRRSRAIPRPLCLSKSEKTFDKRLMLSSLLLNSPGVAEDPPSPCGSRALAESAIPQPLFSAGVNSQSESGLGLVDSSATIPDTSKSDAGSTPTDTQVAGPLDDDFGEFDDLCLDNVDMDDLLEEFDPIDDHANDLLQQPDTTDDHISDLLEQFGAADDLDASDLLDIDDSDLQPMGAAATASGAAIAVGPRPRRFANYEKCLTLLVTDGLYTSDQLHAPPNTAGARQQKIVRVYSQSALRELVLLLRDQWYSTPIAIGNYVNLVGELPGISERGEVVVDSQAADLLLILQPDVLVTCTHLSESSSCLRRAVLKGWVKEIPDKSQPNTVMLLGHLLHELFQSCALQNKWDDATMNASIRSLIKDNIASLWECQIDETTMHQQIAECVPIYQEWARTYMHHSAELGSTYSTHRGGPAASDSDSRVAVSKIFDMEENIWSPKYGLKGKVDLTILAQYSSHGALVQPFELKTGRQTQNTAHRAQLVLYTLLLSDKYDVDINSGLLYYPRSGEVVRVPRIDDELRALVAMRNEMVPYLTQSITPSRRPPAMLGQEFMCSRCQIQPSCFIKHRAIESGSLASAKVSKESWEAQVGHLTDDHLSFVRKWMGLIDGEESDMQQFRAELWNMSADHRESLTGRCLSNMKLEVELTEDTGFVGSYSRYRQTFVPAVRAGRRSFLDSQLSVGDPIVVSSEAGHYAFTIGYVSTLEFNRIVVSGERPVRGVPKRLAKFDSVRNQDFESIMEIRQENVMASFNEETVIHPEIPESAAQDTFRIDKDEMNSAMARVRTNVMRLFAAAHGHPECRRLVVDLQQPTFMPLSEDIESRIQTIQENKRLNTGQAAVLRKVLSAADYALVLGMPGTGKTTTIAELVGLLVDLGKTVLLASYTHIAVDNILLKLQERDIPMIRLGNRTKVHPKIVQYMPSEVPYESVKQMDDYFRKAPVVATTCLGVSHPLFTIRQFDYCIVDEASQITLPVCLGPLLESSKFVLVGDHHQLPPLVRNTVARDGGLGTSLFKRLCEAHPMAVVRLEYQYRMNTDIQRLANNLIYDGHLRCGLQTIANQQIHYTVDPAIAIQNLPPSETESQVQPGKAAAVDLSWVVDVLDPARGAVFIDTDKLRGLESRSEGSDLVYNATEIRIIKVLTSVLQACGIEGRNVGMLSPYRTQLRQLEIEYGIRLETGDIPQSPAEDEAIAADQPKDTVAYNGIEMHTIDRYQGRDADVIVVSWVRSNSHQAIGELLRDWRRINVAITRARLKLIMVGSRSTLQRSPLLAAMLKILAANNGIVQVPSKGLAMAKSPLETRSSSSTSSEAGKPVAQTAGSAILKNRPITSNIVAE